MPQPGELSNRDIQEYFEGQPLFGGCYSQDTLPRLQRACYVVNLERSQTSTGRPLPGTHWMAIVNTRPRCVFYYDSFGREPALAILRRLQETGKKVVWNRYVEQGLSSTQCGLFACFVISQMLAGKSWTQVIRKELRPGRYAANDWLVQ
jgi:hypothetical protein